jgi:hypothetical protein
MSTSFVQTLKGEVARMQQLHPAKEGELARAQALITLGMVQPTDDPAVGEVRSSDLSKTYTVNGACDCQAGTHGKPCKHLHAWRLYQYVERKMQGQAPVAAPVAEPAAALPEAAASVNLRAMVHGFEVQITLRSHDEATLLTRLQALVATPGIRPIPKSAARHGGWTKGH